MFERLLFLCSVFFLCLSCLYLILSLLLGLCPELQLPCARDRQALNPMRTGRMSSLAPWRYTTLSLVMTQPARQAARQLRLLRN